jgi:hypothetical protein
VTGKYETTISYYPVIVFGECEGEEVLLLPLALIGHALRFKVQKGKDKLSLGRDQRSESGIVWAGPEHVMVGVTVPKRGRLWQMDLRTKDQCPRAQILS